MLITMWYCFHWKSNSFFFFSSPSPHFLLPLISLQIMHRLFCKMLKWWSQWWNTLAWESKRQYQNLAFPHLTLLDLGCISWHLTFLFPLVSSENNMSTSQAVMRINWGNISITLLWKHKGSSLMFMTFYAPRRYEDLTFWVIKQRNIFNHAINWGRNIYNIFCFVVFFLRSHRDSYHS